MKRMATAALRNHSAPEPAAIAPPLPPFGILSASALTLIKKSLYHLATPPPLPPPPSRLPACLQWSVPISTQECDS